MRLFFQRFAQFSPNLKEIRIHLCPKGKASEGVREYVAKSYGDIKSKNPSVPVLIRECGGIQPIVWARYEKGKETSLSLTNLSASEIAQHINKL
ncbi:NADH dehydrogenase [ubiquinone] 1 alpha subcomplex subunit 2 [Condylostylus longicornis]|uniref:NADH dehydrogenase [ubiquinone] 1 alpha subcomplex subunit 2 n=1 Tax=Condylostylus longicornis TaxID=2530218 RepID=UPI00244E1A83|nr:NADH dehydrogenase [ubiquinone] 1 alpha subcomplex subunit 2 [Condylostylus longicornis]